MATRLTDLGLGLELAPRDQQTPQALGGLHKAEIERWWSIIKAANTSSRNSRRRDRIGRHHNGVKRTGSSPLPPPMPTSTFFATLGCDDIETAARTPITAAVTIVRMACIAHSSVS
jgi:hypothetical protein